MITSFLKHIKYPFFPLCGGVTCAFKNVDKFIKLFFTVALTISEFYLNLQIASVQLVNKAFTVVANLLKPLKATYLGGFFYTHNLITC